METMPGQGEGMQTSQTVTTGAPPVVYARRRRAPLGAVLLIAIGAFFTLTTFGWWNAKFWPLILVVVGIFILLRRRD